MLPRCCKEHELFLAMEMPGVLLATEGSQKFPERPRPRKLGSFWQVNIGKCVTVTKQQVLVYSKMFLLIATIIQTSWGLAGLSSALTGTKI